MRNSVKIALVILAPIVSLGAVEMGFRYHAYEQNKDTLGAAFNVPPLESPTGRVRFLDIIQPAKNPDRIYELRPNLDVLFKGEPLKTNSYGFRDQEYPLEADDDTITIVGIGASHMFGHGVADGEEYLALLERMLNKAYPAKTWRVINTATPSYNVVMKVETLKDVGVLFEPDIVILHVASNNLDLPTYIRVEEDPFDAGRSFILDFFTDIESRQAETEQRRARLAAVNRKKISWRETIQTDQSKIPPQWRHLVGWDPFYKAMDELAALRDEHGFDVISFAQLDVDMTAELMDESAKRGFRTVMLHDEIVEYVEKHYDGPFALKNYTSSNLVVSKDNLHPSTHQHWMIAQRLMREMAELPSIKAMLEQD